VASIPAVFTLVTECIEEELIAERAEDELVELLLDELVSIHFVDLILAFTDSALSAKRPDPLHGTPAHILFD
jgi:hypothetical protein